MTVRRWLTLVEIDVSICSLTYGTAPCTASVPTTGAQKCFNSVGSCQDRVNYADSTVTLRFVKDAGYQDEAGIEAIPSLVSVDMTPGRIAPGEGLGQRPSVAVTFRDHPHSDTGPGFDKYLSTRSYDPYSQGYFWAKFARRHPNLRGKSLRVIQGYVGQALADMETRHFIIDSSNGPTLDGTFTITAKDPLKSLDGERAVAPAISPGYLNAGINSSTTSATLAPSGIGNTDYPASGYLTLGGKEIVSFTRTNDALTITRAQKGTTAIAHTAGDRVQICLSYTAQDPADIIEDLLTTYGGVDAAYVPIADWQSETAAYNGQVYTGFISEPTSVKTLVAEMIEQAGLALWWADDTETLRLQVLRAISTDAQTFDETQIIAGSLRIDDQPDKRKSQVWTYFAQRTPIDALALDNLPGIAVLEDADAEADYGGVLIKAITSRWIPTGGRLIAERINQLQLGRYVVPPREIEFQIPATSDAALPVLGGGYQLSHPIIQDVDGSRTTLPIYVTRLKTRDGICTVTAEEFNWTDFGADPNDRQIAIDYTTTDVNWRTLHDSLYGTPTSGGTVTLTISSGAVVYSSSTSTPAFQTGTWPSTAFTATRTSGSPTLTSIADTSAFTAGQAVTGTGIPNNSRVVSKTASTVTLDKNATASGTSSLTLWTTILVLVVTGQIIGKGGKGANGRGGDDNTGYSGAAGGLGLEATAPFDLQGAGSVDGGGGGGGGGGGDYQGWFGPQINGGGGGGGAGFGAGGSPASGAQAGEAGTATAGGNGGDSTNSSWHGGDGGAPGTAGNNASGGFAGTGGAAGAATSGIAYVKTTAFTGAFHGTQG